MDFVKEYAGHLKESINSNTLMRPAIKHEMLCTIDKISMSYEKGLITENEALHALTGKLTHRKENKK